MLEIKTEFKGYRAEMSAVIEDKHEKWATYSTTVYITKPDGGKRIISVNLQTGKKLNLALALLVDRVKREVTAFIIKDYINSLGKGRMM